MKPQRSFIAVKGDLIIEGLIQIGKEKKVTPHRVPLPKNAINKEEIVKEAMENDMVHAWLLLAGPLLDEGYALTPLADAVNTYIRRSGGKNESHELRRAQTELGFPFIRLETSRVKSPVELENYKRRVSGSLWIRLSLLDAATGIPQKKWLTQ